MPVFRDLIYTKLDEQLDEAMCDHAVARHLPEFISTFKGALKRRLLQEMADYANGGKTAKRVSKDEPDDKLFLATSVFSASADDLYSFEDVIAYLSTLEIQDTQDTGSFISLLEPQGWRFWERLCSFNSVGSEVAVEVVVALGLDPATARSQDVDGMDWRFVCEYCTGLDVRAYNWRAFVRP